MSPPRSLQLDTARELKAWLVDRARAHQTSVRKIPLDQLEQWRFDPDGVISHASGGFFRIGGIIVEVFGREGRTTSQPIIDQPEVGLLGFLLRIIRGVPYLLVQAKFEPGNIIPIQLSPTVQATRSNYQRLHQGRRVPHLECFLCDCGRVLVDQLQPEQGAFFYQKRNRNMVVCVDGDVPAHEDFAWAALAHVNELLLENNLVNMDARTVLSCLPLGSAPLPHALASRPDDEKSLALRRALRDSLRSDGTSLISTVDLVSWLTQTKLHLRTVTRRMSLNTLPGWIVTPDAIEREDRRYFSVIALDVGASGREVEQWTQPMIAPRERGICALIVRRSKGMHHFLIQARRQPGTFDIVELAPTVQFLPGEIELGDAYDLMPFLARINGAQAHEIRHDSIQSEEGGRFYHHQNRNVVVEIDDAESLELPPNFTWMTLAQTCEFIRHGQFNIEARGLLACLALSA